MVGHPAPQRRAGIGHLGAISKAFGLVRKGRLADDPRVSMDFKPEGPSGDRLETGDEEDAQGGLGKRLALWAARVLLMVFFGPALILLIYTIVPPPMTPLMLIRAVEGYGITKSWRPLGEISPNLQRAVIAAEDSKFCLHGGFDWEAVDTAIERYKGGRRVVGASTISMQTSKNLLLWPGRTFLRKGGEAYITVWLETILSKRRILELYLNVIEFGPGLYGAEAAARHYYGVSAGQLSHTQAAQLAAVLPSPLTRRPSNTGYAGTISARMNSVQLGKRGPCD